MPRTLFYEIEKKLRPLWDGKPDALGQRGHRAAIKILACLRMLAHDDCTRNMDDQARISKTSLNDFRMEFCQLIDDVYGPQFLRRPTADELLRISAEQFAPIGFPGCVGSLDCMHVPWKNAPKLWQGAYANRDKSTSIILQAWCDHDLYVHDIYVGRPGSNNDINALDRSPLFMDILNGKAFATRVDIDGTVFPYHYLLADGIYPEYSFLVRPMASSNLMEEAFTTKQEAVRKNIERCFGVLQLQYKCLHVSSMLHSLDQLRLVVRACVILHNMIVRHREPCRVVQADEAPEPARDDEVAAAAGEPVPSEESRVQQVDRVFAGPGAPIAAPSTMGECLEAQSRATSCVLSRMLRQQLVTHQWRAAGLNAGAAP